MKIKNERYREFIDKGIITLLKAEDIEQVLKKVKGKRGKYVLEARALIITLYLTGCRPAEALELKGSNVTKDGSYIIVHLPTLKHGLARSIYLPERLALVKEMYRYALSLYPEQLLFYHYRNNYVRKMGDSQRIETTNTVYYYVNKWFEGKITPYFFRHNRFSSLAMSGANTNEIQIFKGAKSISSVQPYLHLSSRTMKDLAKKIK